MRLERPLFNVLLRWVWSRDEAMDVMHEAFERVWRRRSGIDETTLEPFVWKVALNVAANRRRSHKLRAMVGLDQQPLPSTRIAADDHLASAQRDELVRNAIDGLPEKLRQVVVMCELSGLSYEVIAQTLGVPVGTVGSRRAAAMERLTLELSHQQEHA